MNEEKLKYFHAKPKVISFSFVECFLKLVLFLVDQNDRNKAKGQILGGSKARLFAGQIQGR
jgi:hypothetical protein